jgi:hypothetical protein
MILLSHSSMNEIAPKIPSGCRIICLLEIVVMVVSLCPRVMNCLQMLVFSVGPRWMSVMNMTIASGAWVLIFFIRMSVNFV